MATQPRRGWQPGVVPAEARAAAGLLMIYPVADRAHVVLTQRRAHLSAHAGQVSLPGGALDAGETKIAAALREAHEEIGVESDALHVLGGLTPLHIPVSGFVIFPIVAVSAQRPILVPSDEEVARILEPELSSLAEESRRGVRDLGRSGRQRRVPFFDVEGLDVWGATAMILAEFLALLETGPAFPPGSDLTSKRLRRPADATPGGGTL